MRILQPGEVFAGCRIVSFCGSGGMGSVYLASDAMQRRIALKIVHAAASERELNGIRSYIRAATGKPGLLQIFHAGIEQDSLYYLMEAADALENTGSAYIPKTLAAVLKREGKLAPRPALELIRDLAGGLEVLHDAGLVHRDIKPENIIFVQGLPKLCDPGLVCNANSVNSFAGTLGFLPPECFDGENLNDPGRDVYALGKVFYIAVSGESPARYPDLPREMPISVQRKFWPVLTRVCANNPKHRFPSVRDFCQALPQELPPAGKAERIMENCRQWILAHPYFLPSVSAGLILLTVGGLLAGGCYYRIRQRRAEELRQCREQCERAGKKFHGRFVQLADQLYAVAGEKAAREILAELKNPPSEPKAKLACYRRLDSRLKELARRQLIPIPAQAPEPEIFRISDAVRGLLASPLADWLEPAERETMLRKLTALEKKVPSDGDALCPGRFFRFDSSFRCHYHYVPPGAFRRKDGTLVRIPYGFWCSDGELRADEFLQWIKWTKSTELPDMPMARFTWNDLLEYCRLKTKFCQQSGQIPPGYIFRPLTVSEWQWACRGAWSGMGQATAFLKNNSGGRVHPVRAGQPNGLGLYDFLGNVAEMVIPDSGVRPEDYHIAHCGGYYNSEKAEPDKCTPYLKYQWLPPYIGTRIAVAPGSMEFFDRALWVTGPRETVFQGRHYELLATNATNMDQETARKVCRLLGGRLFVPESDEQIKALRKVFTETGTFPVSIDGGLKDGVWTRPDGKPYTGVKLPPVPKHPAWSFTFHRGKIRCYPGGGTCGFICEWTEAEYRRRTDPERIRKSGVILHRFKIGSTEYLLVRYPDHSHTARRLAQILGMKLAQPRTKEIRERFLRELEKWKETPVMLGGHWKYGKWVLADGSVLDMELPLRGQPFMESLNPASPGLLDGKFCALQRAQALLLEFPLE